MASNSVERDGLEERFYPDLPPELLLDVFSRLANDLFTTENEILAALHALCRVCHAWARISRPLLYRRVGLKSSESAMSFVSTLQTTPFGALVGELLIWTAVYEYPGAVGRPPKNKTGRLVAPSKFVKGDRFMDAIAQNCPNLRHLAIENRAPQARSIVLPRPREFSAMTFSGLSRLDLDAGHCTFGRGFWVVEAASKGELEFPHLEDLRLRCRSSESLSYSWARLPRLRRLVVTETSLSNNYSIKSLLSAAPALVALYLSHLRIEEEIRLTLPAQLTLLSIWDSLFPILQLPSFLTPCAASLEDLELNVSYISGERPTWPEFPRLRRLKTTWGCIADWSLGLVSSVLGTLRALEIVADRTPEEAAMLGAASTAIADLLLHTPPLALETALFLGNPTFDVERLAAAVHKIPRLQLLGLGISAVDALPSLLSRLPVNLPRLELHLESPEPSIRRGLREALLSVLLPSTSLQNICIVEDIASRVFFDRKETISVRYFIANRTSLRIVYERDDDGVDPYPAMKTIVPPPLEDEVGLVPSMRKAWRGWRVPAS